MMRLIEEGGELLYAVDAEKDADEAELRGLLMGMAGKGDTVAAIFLGKSQFGWRDRDDCKITLGGDGGDVRVVSGNFPLDQRSVAATAQQAEFCEKPPRPPKRADGKRGSPGIEGLRPSQLSR
ncbi:hypothetical protein [Qipengyuania sp. NPDC077563]|uniref:hypothetical protein n=1 Tax=Qipengyuania sp. NPDC077563 TaxID=3364497 RepID=UPI00384C531B